VVHAPSPPQIDVNAVANTTVVAENPQLEIVRNPPNEDGTAVQCLLFVTLLFLHQEHQLQQLQQLMNAVHVLDLPPYLIASNISQ